MLATRTRTSIVAVPVTPESSSAIAVTTTDPLEIEVSTPADETVATAGLSTDHATAWFVAFSGSTVHAICSVVPSP
jgi:hypothetical protein